MAKNSPLHYIPLLPAFSTTHNIWPLFWPRVLADTIHKESLISVIRALTPWFSRWCQYLANRKVSWHFERRTGCFSSRERPDRLNLESILSKPLLSSLGDSLGDSRGIPSELSHHQTACRFLRGKPQFACLKHYSLGLWQFIMGQLSTNFVTRPIVV